jgi:hypothetical protein
VNGRSRPVIMANMRERISRGDIKQEREEAIKVRSHPTAQNVMQTDARRQCVILQQTVQSNSKRHKCILHSRVEVPLTMP